MPTVKNLSNGRSCQCNAGDSLKDVSDQNSLGIPFGCANGICGTCLIKVEKGEENLSPMNETEEMTLKARMAEPGERLACQCKVNGDVEFEQ